MIYLFHGSDIEKARSRAFEWVAKARAKEPNLAYARLAREEVTDASLEDATGSSGLFVSRLLILIDDPFPGVGIASEIENTETEEIPKTSSLIEKHLDALAASDNAIIILAPKLPTATAKKLVAKAKVEYKFDLSSPRREAARGFNATLVNALATRSREKLWLEINRARMAGDAPEMLHGLLHWEARDLMEKRSRAWTPQESRRLSLDLIELLQSSRRGGLNLSIALEKLSLSI